MKTHSVTQIGMVVCCVLALRIGAATFDGEARLEVGERGANHRVWNKVSNCTNSLGQVQSITNLAYTELATGLNYRDGTGAWRESQAEFSVVPGWAVARKGPHKVSLAYNLNVAGAVAVELPDGRILRSSVLSLHYLDKSSGKSVRLAEVKDCAGVVLPPNQVIYTNAFTGVKADVRFEYTKAGIEQDVILRERPPRPESFGLNPATTRLAVLTEFINPPVAMVKTRTVDDEQSDEEVGFGSMLIGRGRAFGMATNAPDSMLRSQFSVRKKWLEVNGRQFLMEQVPLPDVSTELDKLPLQSSIAPKPARTLVAGLDVPATRSGPASEQPMEIAEVWRESPGFVMDYLQLNASVTNFTFQSNQTYLVSSRVDLHGLTIFEGGSVIKCASVPGMLLVVAGWYESIWCKSAPQNPVIFTSVDDDSVGNAIAGSTGMPDVSPTNNIYFSIWEQPNLDVHDVRMSYAYMALMIWNGCSGKVSNMQALHSQYPFWIGDSISLRNILIQDARAVAFWNPCNPISIEHMTVDGCGTFALWGTTNASLALTNSLLVGVQSLGNVSLTTNSVVFADTNSPVFQSFGAGEHYLVADSPYRDVGTANIDSALLANLQQMTTYPPPDSYPDATSLDLGFHYPVKTDWDADGMEDGWEWSYFGNLAQTANGDYDSDGLTNLQEFLLGRNPKAGVVPDTNGVVRMVTFTPLK